MTACNLHFIVPQFKSMQQKAQSPWLTQALTTAAAGLHAGGTPLQSLNPGRTLTQANAQGDVHLAVSLETAPTAVSAALALKPVSSSSSSAITWTFDETYAGSGVGQLVAAATHAAGSHAGMCMTSRSDMQAVQLAPCQRKGQPLFKAQIWMWFGGQLKNSGDGKCLAQGHGGQLRPVSCPAVNEADRLVWAFGGEVSGEALLMSH
jgi:hypothetical protein